MGAVDCMGTHNEVTKIFDVLLSHDSRKDLEIELRFGTIGGRNNFIPGVKRDYMESAIRRLQSNPTCVSTEWVEHEDYFYDLDIDGRVEQVRTRVNFDPYELNMKRDHTIKKRLACVTLRAGALAIRIALSHEVPVAIDTIPMHVNTRMVRFKQRKSFAWSRQESSTPPWSYDFSLVWEGITRNNVDTARSSGQPCTHEFELELDVNSDYIVRHSANYLASSMLMKAKDFIESPVPFSVVTPFVDCGTGTSSSRT